MRFFGSHYQLIFFFLLMSNPTHLKSICETKLWTFGRSFLLINDDEKDIFPPIPACASSTRAISWWQLVVHEVSLCLSTGQLTPPRDTLKDRDQGTTILSLPN
ncbi:hypothetical protein EDC04DRAFT_2674331 [Pisolithus marmoratus]|nr:hypothetical protein EDC04DRAFT_2674331 [Pisolithus marmoratus]